MLTEQGDFPCDYGSKRSELETEFSHHNLSDIEEVWWTEDETYPQVTTLLIVFPLSIEYHSNSYH